MAAGALVLSISFGGGLAVKIMPSKGLPGVRGGSAPKTTRPPANAARVKARLEAEFDIKSSTLRLQRGGFKIEVPAKPQYDSACARHAYGRQVPKFLRSNPCTLLMRTFVVVKYKEAVILVAISRVDMPTAAQAKTFKRIVDEDGTGNIIELSTESGPFRDVKYTGERYLSNISGTTVRNVQAEPAYAKGAIGLAAQVLELIR